MIKTDRPQGFLKLPLFSHKIALNRPEAIGLSFFLFVGLAARLRSYLAGISLWVDEAALANNLVALNFSQLFGPLAQNQVAPIGFCLFEKFMMIAWGNNEFALKFLPFTAGSLALVLAFVMVYRVLGPLPAVLCAAQLAVIKEPLFYATDLKPYASDLAVALGLVSLAWSPRLPQISGKRFWLLFFAGNVAVWFSFPSVFVLGAIGIVYLAWYLKDRQWREAVPFAVMGLVWLAAFAVQYHLLQSDGRYDDLVDAWTNRFAVLLPGSLEDLKSDGFLLYYVFRNPLWTSHPVISIPLYLAGCVLVWRKDKRFLLLMVLPLVLNFLASGLHAYPFRDRLLQYAVVFLFVPIAFSLTWLVKRNFKQRWIRWAGVVLIAANLAEPTVNAVQQLAVPARREELKQVVIYLKSHMAENDGLYIYAHAMKTFSYYENQLKLSHHGLIVGLGKDQSTPERIQKEMDHLTGRVWLVFGHAKQFKGVDYESKFLKEADRQGKRIDQYVDVGASTYLYSFPSHRR
ncbi:MAG: hypothetical protein P8X55_13720 [Desulfosarcinaceae bacterium]